LRKNFGELDNGQNSFVNNLYLETKVRSIRCVLGVWEGRFGLVPGALLHLQFQGTAVPDKKILKKNKNLHSWSEKKTEKIWIFFFRRSGLSTTSANCREPEIGSSQQFPQAANSQPSTALKKHLMFLSITEK